MVNTCKNCKHWGRAFPNACNKVGYMIPRKEQSRRRFEIQQFSYDLMNEAELMTGPDFGCVLFESPEVTKINEQDKAMET